MKVKRTLAFLLALTMIFTIVGCTKVSKDEKKTTTTTAESTTKKNKSEKETTTGAQTTQTTSQTTTTTKVKTTNKPVTTVKSQNTAKSGAPDTGSTTSTTQSITQPTTPKSPAITVTDTSGQVITIDKPLSRIVVLGSGAAKILKAFGVSDRVVGAATTVKSSDPALSSAMDVGGWKGNDPGEPEKIIALKPDAIFAYSNPAYFDPTLKAKFEAAGIKCILIDFNYETQVISDMTAMGKLFGCEAKAQIYIDFYNKYKNLISTRLAGINDIDKPRVYYEGYVDYKSVNKNDGGHQLIVGAGGINIAADQGLGTNGTQTSPDFTTPSGHAWIINQNPDAIIKSISSTDSRKPFGASVTNTAVAKSIYDGLLARDSNAWSTFNAATSKPKKVLLISSDIATNATGGIIGKLYIAKMLYPDKFSDIDPYSVYTELMKNFFGQNLTGTYAYYES